MAHKSNPNTLLDCEREGQRQWSNKTIRFCRLLGSDESFNIVPDHSGDGVLRLQLPKAKETGLHVTHVELVRNHLSALLPGRIDRPPGYLLVLFSTCRPTGVCCNRLHDCRSKPAEAGSPVLLSRRSSELLPVVPVQNDTLAGFGARTSRLESTEIEKYIFREYTPELA